MSRPSLASRAAILATALAAALAAGVGTAPARQAGLGPAPAPDPGETPPIAFRHLGTSDGLSNSAVLSVTQDALGFIWIGTADGLDRYDGEVVRPFRHDGSDESLTSNVVQALAPGRGGAVWVGTAAGLDRYDPATERFESVESLAGRDVLKLLADTTGGVWVGTANGLVRVSPTGEALSAYRHDAGDARTLPDDAVSALALDGDRLWVGTADGLAYLEVASGDVERVRSDSLGVINVSSVARSAGGGVLMGTFGGGLFRYRPDAGFDRISVGGDVLGDVVSSVHEDADGAIWVGTIGGGLRRAQPGAAGVDVYVNETDSPTSLVDDQVSALWEDRQGVMWVATYGGLDRFDRARGSVERIRHDPEDASSLASDEVMAVLAAADGTLYVGTGRSLDVSTDGETFTHLRLPPNTRSNTVHGATALLQDRAGAVWVGTDGNGLFRLDGTTFNRVDPIVGSSGDQMVITSIFEDRSGMLWIGTVNNGLFLYDMASNKAVNYSAADGLESNRIESVAQSLDGSVWVGTDNGLCRVDRAGDEGEFTCISASSGSRDLRNGYIQSILTRSDGSLWIGTRAGLHRLNTGAIPDGCQHVGRSEGLPGESVYGILEDQSGTLWLSTNGGLVQFEPVTGTITRQLALGSSADRSLGAAIGLDRAGRVYVGGTAGLLSFDPENLAALNPNPPQVVLTDVSVEGQDVVPGPDAPLHVAAPVADELNIDYDQTVVTFEYAGLHFSDPTQNRYRYRLDGFDDDWREAGDGGARREVTYTNLDPGSYVFEVEASNADGVWSEAPARIEVHVRPPWWRTLWAYLGFAALAVFGLVRADRWQRARLLREERERAERRETELRAATAEAERRKVEAEADALKAQAERQTAELDRAREAQEANAKLAAANERLEASIADLHSAQGQLVQAEKLASLGQLTAGIAHEIKNPLNFVNNFAELSVELADELDEELQQHADQSVASIRGDLEPLLADLKENARRIHEHGQRADRIVRAMLLHSRGGTDEKARVNVNAFVEEYANLAYHGAKANEADFQVVLERDLGAETGEADVVPQELGRVLINLLTNAFYAVQKQSTSGETSYAPTVTVRTRREGANVQIEVEDNGTGISEEVQRRIFEPFFTTKPTGEGTGLGLSLAHDIVTGVHGGEMDMKSDVGEGTTFRIAIPAAPSPVEPS